MPSPNDIRHLDNKRVGKIGLGINNGAELAEFIVFYAGVSGTSITVASETVINE